MVYMLNKTEPAVPDHNKILQKGKDYSLGSQQNPAAATLSPDAAPPSEAALSRPGASFI